ncbi:60S ribosomal protein L44 [Tanacetum coccineum]
MDTAYRISWIRRIRPPRYGVSDFLGGSRILHVATARSSLTGRASVPTNAYGVFGIEYMKGKDCSAAQGKRRYDRNQSEYGGQTRPVFHNKAVNFEFEPHVGVTVTLENLVVHFDTLLKPFHDTVSEAVVTKLFHDTVSEAVVAKPFHDTVREEVITHDIVSEAVVTKLFHDTVREAVVTKSFHDTSSETVVAKSLWSTFQLTETYELTNFMLTL